MAHKPDPELLKLSTYPYRLSIDTQFSDMDAYAHLNNLAIARFYESARARLLLQVTGRDDFYQPSTPDKMLLVEARLQYLAEGQFPAPVDVATGIGHIGNRAYHIHQALFQNGHCIGLCEVVMVYAIDGKATPIPTAILKQLESQRLANFTPASSALH